MTAFILARGADVQRPRPDATTPLHDAETRGHWPPPNSRGPASVADELAKLGDLLHQGLLTCDEFEQQRARVLAS